MLLFDSIIPIERICIFRCDFCY